jgi:hypothetical protein
MDIQGQRPKSQKTLGQKEQLFLEALSVSALFACHEQVSLALLQQRVSYLASRANSLRSNAMHKEIEATVCQRLSL